MPAFLISIEGKNISGDSIWAEDAVAGEQFLERGEKLLAVSDRNAGFMRLPTESGPHRGAYWRWVNTPTDLLGDLL